MHLAWHATLVRSCSVLGAVIQGRSGEDWTFRALVVSTDLVTRRATMTIAHRRTKGSGRADHETITCEQRGIAPSHPANPASASPGRNSPPSTPKPMLRLDCLRGRNGPRPWNWTPAL